MGEAQGSVLGPRGCPQPGLPQESRVLPRRTFLRRRGRCQKSRQPLPSADGITGRTTLARLLLASYAGRSYDELRFQRAPREFGNTPFTREEEMAEAKIMMQDGISIEVSGTAEEVAAVVKRLRSGNASPGPEIRGGQENRRIRRSSAPAK